jgi:LmbE family N-acetylglucosaminyl deacetylase
MSKNIFKVALSLYLIFAAFVLTGRVYAAGPQGEIPAFSAEDRVLILAPHPDDEAIGTGGVIQKALGAGAKVKVGLFTNGDNNELAFIVYEKRITFRRGEFLHMGEVRRKETLAAMAFLGLAQDDIVFMGYPDYGTMEILTKYWGKTPPYRSMFPGQTVVPYPEALSPQAPYIGESILKDLEKIIAEFKPTKIFVSHPVDTNRDHRALYVFLRIALWDLEGALPEPRLFPYIVHVVKWPSPRGYHSSLTLDPPPEIRNGEIPWQGLALSDGEIKKKHDAIGFYKSQIACDPPYLFTFARKNELFGDYPDVRLKRQGPGEVTWRDIGIADEIDYPEGDKANNDIAYLGYALQDKNLLIKIRLKRQILEDYGITINLLGYKKETDFARMPKIQLRFSLGGLRIKDKKQTLRVKDAQVSRKGNELIFTIPLSVLGDPKYLLGTVRTHAKELPLDALAWRVLILE